jgi:AcrR family transcriptional regulator
MPRPRSDIEPRLVAAARARFLSDGVDGASLRAIAADAGTSIGMVYYYFPTKDELFLAVVEEVYEKLVQDLDRALDPALPVRERLERMFERIARLTDEEITIVRLVVREALVSSSRLDRLVERFRRGHVAVILKTVFEGFQNGTFDHHVNPVVVALATVSLAGPAQLIRRFAAERLPIQGAPAGEDLSRELVRVLFEGVGAKRCEP